MTQGNDQVAEVDADDDEDQEQIMGVFLNPMQLEDQEGTRVN